MWLSMEKILYPKVWYRSSDYKDNPYLFFQKKKSKLLQQRRRCRQQLCSRTNQIRSLAAQIRLHNHRPNCAAYQVQPSLK